MPADYEMLTRDGVVYRLAKEIAYQEKKIGVNEEWLGDRAYVLDLIQEVATAVDAGRKKGMKISPEALARVGGKP